MWHKIARLSLLLLLASALMAYDFPKGWTAGGSRPDEYQMGIDEGAGRNGKNAATIRSKKKETTGFGSLFQTIASDKYKGKRVRFTVFVKTKNVSNWAGPWMSVHGELSSPLTGKTERRALTHFNMFRRGISGDTDFTKYDVVLDVPDSSVDIAYGVELHGPGQVWFDGVNFETVGNEVPVSNPLPSDPSNLDFDAVGSQNTW